MKSASPVSIWLWLLGVPLLAMLAIFVLGFADPATHLEKKFARLVRAVEKGDKNRFASLVSDDYRDDWGFAKADLVDAVERMREHFVFLQIDHDSTEVRVSGNEGVISTHFQLSGRGGPLAQVVIDRANEIQTPTELRWHRPSWRPWHWVLVSVRQPEADPHISINP